MCRRATPIHIRLPDDLLGVRWETIRRVPQGDRLAGGERSGGCKLIQAVLRAKQMGSSIGEIRTLIKKKPEEYEAETTGPRTFLDAPSPKSTGRRT